MKITHIYVTYYSDTHVTAKLKAEDPDTGVSLELEMSPSQRAAFTNLAESIVEAELEARMQKTMSKGFEGRLALASREAIDTDFEELTDTPS